MSTRCQIIIKDSYCAIWLYHHWDGYPSNIGPMLQDFVAKIRSGQRRNNAEQSAGWLIRDYPSRPDSGDDWKASEFEPCSAKLHGDTEWLYRVDVEALTIEQCAIAYNHHNYEPKLLAQQVFVPLDITVG